MATAIDRNSVSDLIFISLPVGSFPVAVFPQLVEMHATMPCSMFTASNSKKPPADNFTGAHENEMPNVSVIHVSRTDASARC